MIKDYINWPHALDMGQGKLEPGYSIHEKTITHWEWRDGESSVYPLWQEAGRWCICALGLREPDLVLRTPVAGDICKG